MSQCTDPLALTNSSAKEAERYRDALQESEARLASFDTQEGLVAPDEERTNMGLKLADAVAASSCSATIDRGRSTPDPGRAEPDAHHASTIHHPTGIKFGGFVASAITGQTPYGTGQSRPVADEV